MSRYLRIFSFSFKYTILCLGICFCLFLIGKLFPKNKKIGTFLMMFVLFVFSAIRVNSGSDFINYFTMYNTVLFYFGSLTSVFKSTYQSGFLDLSYLVQKYIGGEYSIFVVIALFGSIATLVLFYKYTSSPRLALGTWVLSGFFLISMNVLKQYIAMIFIMFAFFSMKKNKYIMYFCYVVCASIFHITAIIPGVMPLFLNVITLNKKSFASILLTSGVISLLIYPILNIFTKIPLFSKYSIYLSMASTVSLRFIISAMITVVVYSIIIFLLLNPKIKLNETTQLYLKILIIGMVFAVISFRFFFLSRISYYFLQFLPFLVGSLETNVFKSRYQGKNTKKLFFCVLAVYCFLFTSFSGENNYYNYSTRFNDVPASVMDFVGR